ncbi:MAG: cytochrome c5 family protein [Gammaproteobacteria bacterium]|nr:cytochrome c5 family protein [Gammaproteobacteria bacterium]
MKKISAGLLFCAWVNVYAYHNPSEVLKQIHQNKAVGKGVYDTFCGVCHEPDPQIQVGAPRRGIKSDWYERTRHQSLNTILKNVDEGINNMPARGGCFECTDEDLLAATRYLMGVCSHKT